MSLSIDIDLKPTFKQIIQETDKKLERANVIFAREVLDTIEKAQILAYTSSGKPSQPSGSRYRRTFTLQKSSVRRTKRVTARVIDAEWFTTLDYAPKVLGQASDQALIHRGRWKSLEQVVREVDQQISDIYDDSFRKAK